MIEFTERMLRCAAEHKLHIQIHGSSKFSGEQRTFPNLFNREGVLNLEFSKWSNRCDPAHSVNVAYTRALAGPVDYHLGGFRSVSRNEFEPRNLLPMVLGSRCHNLALYVVYENPMPMVADTPDAYKGQIGFEFLKKIPVTWDETRFLDGESGQYMTLARRSGNVWYLGNINNWTARSVDVPLDFLADGVWRCELLRDASLDDSSPNEVSVETLEVQPSSKLSIALASGGGFVVTLRKK